MARSGMQRVGVRGAGSVLVVVATALVPLGCASGRSDEATAALDGGSAVEVGDAAERSASQVEGVPASVRPREIVRTGELSVVADDVDEAVRRAELAATERGGYVEAENASSVDVGSASITYRVPADQFAALLRDLSRIGEVESRNVTTDDVTDQAVDLDARIVSAQRSVDRVRSFLDEANNVTELASVEAELLRRETELEQLTAQRRAMSDQVALATVRLSITSEPTVAPSLDPLRKVPGFGHALADGVGALVSAARVVGAGVGYALPFLVALGLPMLAVRAFRRRRPAPTAA